MLTILAKAEQERKQGAKNVLAVLVLFTLPCKGTTANQLSAMTLVIWEK